MITDPKGNEVPFEEGYSTIIDSDFIQKENSLIETDFRHDDISTSDFDKNDFTNAGLDPFEDPQETPTVNEGDSIRTDVDKEPIKLTLRKNLEEGNNEYYIASKDQSQESQNNIENDSEQPSLKMTLKRRPNGNSDDYYISGYTLEMNDHLKTLEQLENESEPNENDLENLTTCNRQQMAEMGHYTHVDQLRDRLDYYPVGSFPEEKLRALQLEDPMGGMIIKYLEEQILPEEKRMRERVYKSENNFLIDENSRLLYHVELVAGGLVKDYCLVQLFVPEDICDYLIQEYHQRAHQGLDRLVAQIRQRYWFPRMVTKISNYINNCNICQLQKQLRNPFKAPLKTRKVVTNAGEVWYLDHFGPINTRKLGSLHSYAEDELDNPLKEETKYCPYKYVLVAVDSYTLYTELILCKGTSAAETAKLIFEEIICRHSWPKALVHDQGTAFVNQLLEEFTRLTGMKNYQTAAMNPRANGVSEARVKIVSIALSKLVNEHLNDWFEYIPVIRFAINCTPTMANGLPPFLLQHARWPEDPASLALLENTTTLKTHLEYFALLVEKVRMWRKVAITHRRFYNERMKRAYSTNLRPPTELGIGEFCYLRVPYLSTITSHVKRLSIPWRGPFIISDILPDG